VLARLVSKPPARVAALAELANVAEEHVTHAVDALVPVSFDRLYDGGRSRESAHVLAGFLSRLPQSQRHDVLAYPTRTAAPGG